MSGILYLCRKKLSHDCLKAIYFALAYSHLTYCVSLWGGTWTNHLRCVVVAQKRILRVITYASRQERSLPLFIENNLLSVKYVFMYFTLLLMFKFVNLNYCGDIFRMKVILRNTRNNQSTIQVPLFRTVRSQKSILFIGPKTWNALPFELRNITNLNTFKSKLKSYLFHQQSLDLQ